MGLWPSKYLETSGELRTCGLLDGNRYKTQIMKDKKNAVLEVV